MKKIALAFALLATSLASGQWPRTIDLDTLDWLTSPTCLAYNPITNAVYVAGGGLSSREDHFVTAIDAATLRRVARIPVAPRAAGAITVSPSLNKVYVAHTEFGSAVSVIDAQANEVLALLEVATTPRALCVNPVNNKVYCACEAADSNLYVIDGAGDSVRAVLSEGHSPIALCPTPDGSKVYVVNYGWPGEYDSTVTVIDGFGDTAVATVVVGDTPTDACFNPVEAKVYVAVGGNKTVVALDTASNEILATIPTGVRPHRLSWSHHTNKLYCWCMPVAGGDTSQLVIIDCTADTVLKVLGIGHGGGSALLCDPNRNVVYCAIERWDSLYVVCGSGDSILTGLRLGDGPLNLCFGPEPDRVFVVNIRTQDVSVVDAEDPRVEERVYVGPKHPRALTGPPDAPRVFCSHWQNEVSTIDAVSGEVIAQTRVGNYPTALLYVEEADKLYCANTGLNAYEDSTVSVLNATTGQVIATVAVGREPIAMCYSDSESKVYVACRADARLSVIDAAGDSLVATVEIDSQAGLLCYNPAANKVYVGCGTPAVLIIDAASDSVVAVHRGYGNPLRCVACSPEMNRVYFNYFDGRTNYLAVIDGASDSVVGRIELPFLPLSAAYAANDTLLWFSGRLLERGAGAFAVDCAADTSHVAISMPQCRDGTHALLSEQSGRLYVVCPGTDNVGVIDAVAGSWLGRIDVETSPNAVHVCPATGDVFVANGIPATLSLFPDTIHLGIAERAPPRAQSRARGPTLLRSGTPLRSASEAALVSITGRKVMDLHPGENDIRHLPPGIYFIHSSFDNQHSSLTRKVIVTR